MLDLTGTSELHMKEFVSGSSSNFKELHNFSHHWLYKIAVVM